MGSVRAGLANHKELKAFPTDPQGNHCSYALNQLCLFRRTASLPLKQSKLSRGASTLFGTCKDSAGDISKARNSTCTARLLSTTTPF